MSVILSAVDDMGVLTITLNRPDKLNALNQQVLEALSTSFARAQQDDSIKGIILTGQGKAFCAGADIAQLAECDAQSGYEFACYGQTVFAQLAALNKPSIALVNGYAFGGGCELAMAATLRIAADVAQFAQPEVKLGVIPGYGGTQRLARLIGKGRALDLCLSGRVIDANTANQWGLVNDVVVPEQLLSQGKVRLAAILALAPLAIASVLQVIEHGYDMSLTDALHLEAVHFAKTCASDDKREGVAAFLAKRPPVFHGR